MRRGERAIESKDGQKAILEHCRVCSLAFSGDEYPYVIPLNYGFCVERRPGDAGAVFPRRSGGNED